MDYRHGLGFLRRHGEELKKFLLSATAEQHKFVDNEKDPRYELHTSTQGAWEYCNNRDKKTLNGIIAAKHYGYLVFVAAYIVNVVPKSVTAPHYYSDMLYGMRKQRNGFTMLDTPVHEDHLGVYVYTEAWDGPISKFIGHEMIMSAKQPDGRTTIFRVDYVGGLAYNEAMEVTLRELSPADGEKEREFLLSLPEEENGFHRPGRGYDLTTSEGFREFKKSQFEKQRGENLPEGYVPSSLYWVLVDGELAGVAKIRHHLNDALREHGGHIGLAITEKFRGQGIGTEALHQLIFKARAFTDLYGHEDILVTIQEENTASRKIAEANGGQLEKIKDGRAYYWFR